MNRRSFVLGGLTAGSIFALPGVAKANPKYQSLLETYLNSSAVDMAPLERLTAFSGSSVVEGDLQDEAHEIFWNKDGYLQKKGGIPAVSEEYDVVIVGGGLAGMSAAYYLKGKKILIIEGHNRFGGNAKSQTYNRSVTSMGSAYITIPDEGDEIDTFLKQTGLKKQFRLTDTDEPVIMNGKIVHGFWAGGTDIKNADQFKAAAEKFKDVWDNNYPELPCWDNSTSGRGHFNSLDTISFTNWLKRELGEVHPHVMEYVTLYCWSSFSASPDEISAAQGLNFLSCDLNGDQVLPGGNGIIANTLFNELSKRSGVKLVNQSFGVDIKSEGGKSVVCYKDSMGALKTVRARHTIVANSKMVAKKVISGLSSAQEKAMDLVNYRAYLVANIFLKKKVKSTGYDLFTMYGTNPTNGYEDSKSRVFADVIFADWAGKDVADKSILTLYMPLPYDMAQQYLFVDGLHAKYVDRLKPRLLPVLQNVGLTWSDVEGVRLVRYGHSMPVAAVGGVASGLFERASASIDNCIHFANQDNWGNPCFETSFGSALRVVEKI